ncbi:MAG: hypothetical protein QOF68_189 [Gaiellales bacterium]|nr:hypothetical protein [Gaiellales bacterium]
MTTTHNTPDSVTLRLRLPSGRIEITTWDKPRTDVDVQPLRDDDAARRYAADVRHELRRRGSGHELVLEARGNRGLFSFRDTPLSFTIRAPHGAHIDADTASADIAARGRFGGVEIQTASGDVIAETIDGDATVRSANGTVELGDVSGPAKVNAVAGDVRIGSVGGDAAISLVSGDLELGPADANVTVKTVAGDVDLTSVQRGSVRAQSVSGDITIRVARGTSVWMDIGSLSGETVSELDSIDEPSQSGDVAVEIKASSTSGDVRLARAAERTPV